MKKVSLPDEDAGFDMAPMIDMVFLLLIFFMTASTFPEMNTKKVVLPIASASSVPKNKKHPIVITIDKEGLMFWGKDQSDLTGISERMIEALERNPEERVYIRADKEVTHKSVREVIAACSKAGAADIIFAALQSP